MVQYLSSDRAEQPSAEDAVPVRGHHDQVRVMIYCVSNNLGGGLAAQENSSYVEMRKCGTEKIAKQFLGVLFSIDAKIRLRRLRMLYM
jgi:hypothetical protein